MGYQYNAGNKTKRLVGNDKDVYQNGYKIGETILNACEDYGIGKDFV